ncbi:MAG: PQQ-dependent sugar dehydrogenase, partial [Anaerolineaceae bacterium]|nr:PQQ-dependent sugar dehydrogenase [Anaerolineaceae bacterium]
MKLKGIMIFSILIVVVLASCSGSEVTFTPSVLEIPTATNPVMNTPIPTLKNTEAIENEPTQTVVKIEDGAINTVKTFPDPSQYQWQEITSGLTKPLGMTTYYDENLLIYILEQDGVIRILENGVLLAEPFLDIKNKTTTRGSEQGLLGIALDPNYADNGIFYLNYSGRGGDTVIARFVAKDDRKVADPGSEQIILTYEQPYSNHNGGNLVFGPDGFLYVGLGDGGSGGDPEMRAQNPDTLLGKMLRIAVQDQEIYAIPSDNPYQSGGGRAEI